MAERVTEIARKGKARETASLAADAVGLADGTESVYSSPDIASAPGEKRMRARWKSLVAKLLVLSGTSLLCLVIFESVLLVRAGYYKNFEGETASITYVNRIYWQPDLISGY